MLTGRLTQLVTAWPVRDPARLLGTTVSVRPSGTEPKIKFYFGVKAPLASVADFDEVQAELDAKIEGIKRDLKLE